MMTKTKAIRQATAESGLMKRGDQWHALFPGFVTAESWPHRQARDWLCCWRTARALCLLGRGDHVDLLRLTADLAGPLADRVNEALRRLEES